jgi:hypothetical protein
MPAIAGLDETLTLVSGRDAAWRHLDDTRRARYVVCVSDDDEIRRLLQAVAAPSPAG